jgi:hypothetical protein
MLAALAPTRLYLLALDDGQLARRVGRRNVNHEYRGQLVEEDPWNGFH